MNNKFEIWNPDIHTSVDQLKRISFISRIKPENVEFDYQNETSVVKGTDGIYNVSLESCTCYDFSSRHLPCKHMYHLAKELGYLNFLPDTNRKSSKLFKDSLPNEIERYKNLYFDGAISLEKLIKIINAINSK